MKMKRNYLTTEEINAIIVEVMNRQFAFERRIVELALVAQFLIEDLPKFDDCDGIYNYLMENEIDLYELVINIYDIDECVAEELNINQTITQLVENLNKKIDEVSKELNMETLMGLINQFEEVNNKKAIGE